MTNRYKVKGDAANFSELVRLSQAFAKVCTVNDKRHVLSLEGMTSQLEEKLTRAGGKVSAERRFNQG